MEESRRGAPPRVLLRVLVGVLSSVGYLAILLAIAVWRLAAPGTAPEAAPALPVLKHINPPRDSSDPRELYLELLKRTLTRYQFGERYQELPDGDAPKDRLVRFSFRLARALAGRTGLEIVRVAPFNPQVREYGLDWPREAVTMVGVRRLDNLQFCITEVLKRNVPGDLIECGAWRGGACIFMRATLKAYGDTTRKVWVADSFEGLPKPNRGVDPDTRWEGGEMAVSLEEVQQNFRDFGVLDDQVVFLKGFFIDTLPKARIERLAVLRLDADLYESTMQSLDALYDRVSPGGYVIVDDWNLPAARTAVEEFRRRRQIADPILPIDFNGVYWQKAR